MKHIRKFNENWLGDIFKKTEPEPEPETETQSKTVEEIFKQVFKNNPLISNIDVTKRKDNVFQSKNDAYFVRFFIKLDDGFGGATTYLFKILKEDDKLYLKTVGSSGDIDNYYSFKDLELPYINEEYFEESIEIFAKKLKPFIEYLLESDSEK